MDSLQEEGCWLLYKLRFLLLKADLAKKFGLYPRGSKELFTIDFGSYYDFFANFVSERAQNKLNKQNKYFVFCSVLQYIYFQACSQIHSP